jgi:hypothetical protein
MTSRGFHEGDDALVVETREPDSTETLVLTKDTECLAQCVGLGKLTVAIDAEKKEAGDMLRAGEVTEEEKAGLVGPLKVVENHYHGLVLGRFGQQSHHGGEKEKPLALGIGGLRWR